MRGLRSRRADRRRRAPRRPASCRPPGNGAGGAAAGHQAQVARPSASKISRPEPRPRRDDFDDERAAEQRADEHAVDAEHRRQRHRPGVHAQRALARRARGRGWRPRRAGRRPRPWRRDCTRSSVAASGRASASAGTGRCRARSASHGDAARGRPRSCRRPATSPVRAARNTSSERAQERRHRQHDDRRRRARAPASAPRLAPVKRPSGMPTSVATTSAATASTAVLSARSPTSSLTGPVVQRRPAEIEPREPRQPAAVLREQRLVEAELRAQRRAPRGSCAGLDGRDVARRQPRQQQRERGDDQREDHDRQRRGARRSEPGSCRYRALVGGRRHRQRVGAPQQLRPVHAGRGVAHARAHAMYSRGATK